MNEHDSERLAGLMVAEGMVATADESEADVVIFNTCTIRENADLKLYSALGQMKALKEQRPQMQIAVGGCMAQKDRHQIVERANWVDVVFGTHNLASAPRLLKRSRVEGPIVEVLDAPDPEANRDMAPALYAVRELAFAAWITIQTGCDNTCAYCIVPAVRGEEISRPFDDLVIEAEMLAASGVTEITLLGQNVNLVRPRHHSTKPPLRATAARRGPCRRNRTDPLHEPSPQGPVTRDDRGDGRDRDRLSAVAPAAAVRIRPRLKGDAARLQGGALHGASRAGSRGDSRPRGHDGPDRRFPRRERRRV